MATLRALAVAALAIIALDGCRARDNDPGPGGVTVGEARELDKAAEELESRPQAPPLVPDAEASASPAPVAAPMPAARPGAHTLPPAKPRPAKTRTKPHHRSP